MPDFLEKLKKGMNIEIEEDPQEKIPEAVFTSAKTPVKKGKIKVKKEKQKSSPLFEQEGELVIDVFETENNIVIQSAIAGINTDELEISIEKDMIAIKGIRERKVEEETKNYFYQECYWGRFSREVILPVETDATKADAVIKNGILTITIPKANREKNKKLNIKNVE